MIVRITQNSNTRITPNSNARTSSHAGGIAARLAVLLLLCLTLAGCSTTKSIPDGDQLFTGLTKITYDAPEKGEHFAQVQEEVEAALATAPNGALLGSSSVKSPLPIGLWVWNEFAGSKDAFGKWMLSSFGSKPVLMSWVNPELRALVAKEVLRAHGYFRGNVTYDVVQQKNPKKAKIGYTVSMGHLFTIDTLSYEGFPPAADSLIRATNQNPLTSNLQPKIAVGDAFDVSTLDAERTRITNLFRNNGYFFYQPSYASYLADTVSVPGRVKLRFQEADSIPEEAKRPWTIGNITLNMKRQYVEQLNDSVSHQWLTVRFNGKKSPMRAGAILSQLKLRPGKLYSYDDYQESMTKLAGLGVFSNVDFTFTPRQDNDSLASLLDLSLNLVFDKPYDFYVQANMTGKTNNRFGPGVVVGMTRRNAFRGGERLDINLKGSYEWQTGHKAEGTSSKINSYEYGFDATLQFPRLMIPFADLFRDKLMQRMRRRMLKHKRPPFVTLPTTTLKVSSDIVNRADYFTRHIVSGEWSYEMQTSQVSRHKFSPLVFSFEYMRRSTARFDSVLAANPYLRYTMQDQFIPKMQYVYTYTNAQAESAKTQTIWWQTTVSESANLLSLGYMVAGRKWGEKNKDMWGNPYAQFVKVESELVKTWRFSSHSTLVGHVDAGVIWSYGNSETAPYSEQFYVGGANSIRAFTIRSIGPGSYHDDSSASSYYMDQTGDLRLLLNLEWRPRILGSLYGAVFLDAGNVWTLRGDERDGAQLHLKNIFKETALGTGVGLRYDLDFLVLRLDWGIGLHVPYKSGFYNVGSFSDSQSLHFAIGYPF